MLKYQQIATEIETYIEEHQLQQGDKLPVLETPSWPSLKSAKAPSQSPSSY